MTPTPISRLLLLFTLFALCVAQTAKAQEFLTSYSLVTAESYQIRAFDYYIVTYSGSGNSWSLVYTNGSLYGIVWQSIIADAFTPEERTQVLFVGPDYAAAGWYPAGAEGGAVPEPSTYAALAGLAALGFAIWRRRKGRQAMGGITHLHD